MFLNLFIGVILEAFQTTEKDSKILDRYDFPKFIQHWALYDPGLLVFTAIMHLHDCIRLTIDKTYN